MRRDRPGVAGLDHQLQIVRDIQIQGGGDAGNAGAYETYMPMAP